MAKASRKRAYELGKIAARADMPYTACPWSFWRNFLLAHAWNSGWHDGMLEELNGWLADIQTQDN